MISAVVPGVMGQTEWKVRRSCVGLYRKRILMLLLQLMIGSKKQ